LLPINRVAFKAEMHRASYDRGACLSIISPQGGRMISFIKPQTGLGSLVRDYSICNILVQSVAYRNSMIKLSRAGLEPHLPIR